MIHNLVQPFDFAFVSDQTEYHYHELGFHTHFFRDEMYDFGDYQIAIIGVKESRNAQTHNVSCDLAPEEIRKSLYRLNIANNFPKIIDLGNVIDTDTVDETYHHLETIMRYVQSQGLTVIVLGGSQDLTVAQVRSLDEMYQYINVCIVDERIDLVPNSSGINSSNYIQNLILNKSPQVFNLHQFGYQLYYTHLDILEQYQSMCFNPVRLSTLRYDIPQNEYIIRDSHVMSIDIAAVKQADAPARSMQTPNGFLADELCLISRYAGMNSRLHSIGFYELNPNFDLRQQSSQLYAQAIWYFIEGFSFRVDIVPDTEEKQSEYLSYHIAASDINNELKLWKHKQQPLWWIEIPNRKIGSFIPCSQQDYNALSNGHLSNYIYKLYHKL